MDVLRVNEILVHSIESGNKTANFRDLLIFVGEVLHDDVK